MEREDGQGDCTWWKKENQWFDQFGAIQRNLKAHLPKVICLGSSKKYMDSISLKSFFSFITNQSHPKLWWLKGSSMDCTFKRNEKYIRGIIMYNVGTYNEEAFLWKFINGKNSGCTHYIN